MSKFIDNIQEKWTGRRKAPMWFPLKATAEVQPSRPHLHNVREYEFSAEWKSVVSCEPQDVPHVLKNVKRQLQDAVYGEMRPRLLRLEQAIYDYDRETALSELHDMYTEMFGT